MRILPSTVKSDPLLRQADFHIEDRATSVFHLQRERLSYSSEWLLSSPVFLAKFLNWEDNYKTTLLWKFEDYIFG